jgi:hypothetical protein
MEKQPKRLRGSGKGSDEGEAKRILLMGVSNLIITRKNRADVQKKQARRRKALLKEAEELTGSSVANPAGISGGDSAVPVGK